ncbi:hypothetical protein HOK51_03475 [Candidatus Woesearchaeota archaeon]|jgi:hypothetical protein|nr:hypothetical protein [Candidatus Woesearchaeota archaeon]MBT6518881.1 hypothetical protein [Candidatus Woesearchaeota archaeon]MBT7368483.1 hypothetical protein [Candidatus Woesearchaeota archaeon]
MGNLVKSDDKSKSKIRSQEDTKVRELSDVLDQSSKLDSIVDPKERINRLREQAQRDMQELKDQNAQKRIESIKTKSTNQRMHEYATYFEYAVGEKKSVEFNDLFIEQIYEKLNVSDSELQVLDKQVSKLDYKIKKYEAVDGVNLFSIGLPSIILGGAMVVSAFLAPEISELGKQILGGMLLGLVPGAGVGIAAGNLYPRICKNKVRKLIPKYSRYKTNHKDKLKLRESVQKSYESGDLESIFEKVDDIDYAKIIKELN